MILSVNILDSVLDFLAFQNFWIFFDIFLFEHYTIVRVVNLKAFFKFMISLSVFLASSSSACCIFVLYMSVAKNSNWMSSFNLVKYPILHKKMF